MDFINLDKGYVFNGSFPYIHWFDERLSTNIFHVKRLCWRMQRSTCSVSFVDNESYDNIIFGIYDPEIPDQNDEMEKDEEFGGMTWKSLTNSLTDDVVLEGERMRDDEGNVLSDDYYYIIYIVFQTKWPGDYSWKFKISDEEYMLAAEVYEEEEKLKINMMNMGVEIPQAIVKAFPDTDIYEENPDYIALNRKWKEYLVNYMDLRGKKGSYKSLLDSLNWFGYGDAVDIQEIWKYHSPDGVKYMARPVTQVFTDEYKSLLASASKTTSFYLRNIINMTKYKDVNKDDEELEIAVKWTLQEMKLKMLLLGAFYSEYFMPVHTDLVRSVCEEIVDTGSIYNKMKAFEFKPKPIVKNHEKLYVETGSDGKTKTFDLRNVQCFSNIKAKDDPDQNLFEVPEDGHFFRVHELSEQWDYEKDNVDNQSWHWYGGVGVIVPITLKLTLDEDEEDIRYIKKVRITSTLQNGDETEDFYNTDFVEITDPECKSLTFKVLFNKVGLYDMKIEALDQYDQLYLNYTKLTIQDELKVELDFKKVVWDKNKWESDFNPFDTETCWERYMFVRGYNEKWAEGNRVKWDELPSFYIPILGSEEYEERRRKYVMNGNEARKIPVATYTIRINNADDVKNCWNEFWKTLGFTDIPELHINSSGFIPQDTDSGSNLTGITGTDNKFSANIYYRIGSSLVSDTDECLWTDEELKDGHWMWIKIFVKYNVKFPQIQDFVMFVNDIFFPELHKLENITGEDRMYNDAYPVVIQPVIKSWGGVVEPVLYSNIEPDSDVNPWNIRNFSTIYVDENSNYNHGKFVMDCMQPFLSRNSQWTPMGFYRVTFRYNWSGEWKEVNSVTPFRYIERPETKVRFTDQQVQVDDHKPTLGELLQSDGKL